jgi:hypothetical protein
MLDDIIETPYVHYLVEIKIPWHPTHIFSSARTPKTSHHPPCKAKIEKLALVSIILYEIK